MQPCQPFFKLPARLLVFDYDKGDGETHDLLAPSGTVEGEGLGSPFPTFVSVG